MNIVKATPNDYETLKSIEDRSFGAHIIKEEFDLITNQGFGEIFFYNENNLTIGYIVVLYKEYSPAVENKLQPLLKSALSNGEYIMHDDVSFDEEKYVYFHLIGIDKRHQNKGIGKSLTIYLKNYVTSLFPQKKIKVCIRINNVPSIKLCMKELNTCMTSLKPINRKIIGSIETNFNATSLKNIKTKIEMFNNNVEIFRLPNQMPLQNNFYLPVKYGEESDIEIDDKYLKEKITALFNNDYIISGISENNHEYYFFCEKLNINTI